MQKIGNLVLSAAVANKILIPAGVQTLVLLTTASDVYFEAYGNASTTSSATGLPLAANSALPRVASPQCAAPVYLVAISAGGATVQVWNGGDVAISSARLAGMVSFSGNAGAGACTCVDAKVGDLVNWSDGSAICINGRSDATAGTFEPQVTIAGQIQQLSTSDLHSNQYVASLNRGV